MSSRCSLASLVFFCFFLKFLHFIRISIFIWLFWTSLKDFFLLFNFVLCSFYLIAEIRLTIALWEIYTRDYSISRTRTIKMLFSPFEHFIVCFREGKCLQTKSRLLLNLYQWFWNWFNRLLSFFESSEAEWFMKGLLIDCQLLVSCNEPKKLSDLDILATIPCNLFSLTSHFLILLLFFFFFFVCFVFPPTFPPFYQPRNSLLFFCYVQEQFS